MHIKRALKKTKLSISSQRTVQFLAAIQINNFPKFAEFLLKNNTANMLYDRPYMRQPFTGAEKATSNRDESNFYHNWCFRSAAYYECLLS